jgi:hypothetical protein
MIEQMKFNWTVLWSFLLLILLSGAAAPVHAQIDWKVDSLCRFDHNLGKEVDETKRLWKEETVVIGYQDHYIRMVTNAVLPSPSYYYKIDGFDPVWYRFNEDPIRTGSLPEGYYRLVIASKNETGMNTVKVFPLQVRAPFFHGIRGHIAAFVFTVLVVFFFYSGRSWILRRDKSRTVKLLENTVQKTHGATPTICITT